MSIKNALTRAAVVSGLVCWALVPVAPAGAAKPQKIHISESFSEVELNYCDVEGFEVQIEGTFESVLQIRNRQGLEYYSEHQKFTRTDTHDGVSITLVSKPFFKDLHVRDLGDTLEIIFFGTGPLSVYGPDGKAIARNPGQVRFRVVIDEATGEELSLEVIKESTGRNDDFCAAVLPVLMG